MSCAAERAEEAVAVHAVDELAVAHPHPEAGARSAGTASRTCTRSRPPAPRRSRRRRSSSAPRVSAFSDERAGLVDGEGRDGVRDCPRGATPGARCSARRPPAARGRRSSRRPRPAAGPIARARPSPRPRRGRPPTSTRTPRRTCRSACARRKGRRRVAWGPRIIGEQRPCGAAYPEERSDEGSRARSQRRESGIARSGCRLGGAPRRVRMLSALNDGKCTVNVEPLPTTLSALTRPLWASTIQRTIERPSPEPPGLAARGPLGCGRSARRRTGRSASGMPIPVSETEMPRFAGHGLDPAPGSFRRARCSAGCSRAGCAGPAAGAPRRRRRRPGARASRPSARGRGRRRRSRGPSRPPTRTGRRPGW